MKMLQIHSKKPLRSSRGQQQGAHVKSHARLGASINLFKAHLQLSFRPGPILLLLISLGWVQLGCGQQTFRRQKSPLVVQPQPAPVVPPAQQDNVVAEMQVVCQSDAIVLVVNTNNPFNGMLYAKDAPGSAHCISEFHSATNMTFRVPLKSCATLSAEVDDGVEYFNTVVVQPHMRLMTNQGKGYHIRCKYQTRERTIANTHFNVSAAFSMQNGPQAASAPLLATASMPMCTMKIYRIDQDNVAESVRVGDKLVMVIEIDRQDMYGMRIANCVVRDGMNKAEQMLINDSGCPVDDSIMPKFEYEHNNTRAAVVFKAHKFPHTSSVYYQCNVRLCINNNAGCDPVSCATVGDSLTSASSGLQQSVTGAGGSGSSVPLNLGGPRRKRFASNNLYKNQHPQDLPRSQEPELEGNETAIDKQQALPDPSELKMPARRGAASKQDDMSFDVYSGLYVSDITDMAESSAGDPNGQQVLPAESSSSGKNQLESCLTMYRASVLVILASFGSMVLVVLIACQAGILKCAKGAEHDRDYTRQVAARARSLTPPADSDFEPSLSPAGKLSSSSSAGRHHSPSPMHFHHYQTQTSAPSRLSAKGGPMAPRYGL